MSLDQWRQNGWLLRHTPDAGEIEDLFVVADRDLADCSVAALSTDGRFSMAYNAALQMATAALLAAGYQVARGQSHHARAIQSLAHTVGMERALVEQLDRFRVKRRAGVYEKAGAVSRAECKEMVRMAVELRQLTLDWLRKHHSHLLPKPKRP